MRGCTAELVKKGGKYEEKQEKTKNKDKPNHDRKEKRRTEKWSHRGVDVFKQKDGAALTLQQCQRTLHDLSHNLLQVRLLLKQIIHHLQQGLEKQQQQLEMYSDNAGLQALDRIIKYFKPWDLRIVNKLTSYTVWDVKKSEGIFWNILKSFIQQHFCRFWLTLLLSYSLRDSEKSLALEIDIPQNGRYICSTCRKKFDAFKASVWCMTVRYWEGKRTEGITSVLLLCISRAFITAQPAFCFQCCLA